MFGCTARIGAWRKRSQPWLGGDRAITSCLLICYGLSAITHGAAAEATDSKGHKLAELDPVQQVHVLPGAPGTMIVIFTTKEKWLSSKVKYGTRKMMESDALMAEGNVLTYDSYNCPLPGALLDAQSPLSIESLVDLMNLSKVFPSKLASPHFDPGNTAGAINTMKEWGGCLGYKNPRAYTQAPYIHRIQLKNLKPRKMYWYKPVDSIRTFAFVMPPASGESRELRIGVWSNIGIGQVSRAVQADLMKTGPRLLLIPGGLAYADGWSPVWDLFGQETEVILSNVPALITPGLREIAIGHEQGIDMEYRYPMPFYSSGSTSPYYYSYEAGLVHFLNIVGSYESTKRGSPQYDFIQRDLSQVNRTATPWVVVQFSTPWYSSNTAHYLEGYVAKQDLEQLFYIHNVDIVINGLVNIYERSVPVYQEEPDECGIVHLVVGAGGNYQGLAVGGTPRTGSWIQPSPAWSAFRQASWGFGVLTVHNDSHATWQWQRTACGSKVEVTAMDSSVPLDDFYMAGRDGCSTTGDDSLDSANTSDTVVLTRKGSNCSALKSDPDGEKAESALQAALQKPGGEEEETTRKRQRRLQEKQSQGSARRMLHKSQRQGSRGEHQSGAPPAVAPTTIPPTAFEQRQATSTYVRPQPSQVLSQREVQTALGRRLSSVAGRSSSQGFSEDIPFANRADRSRRRGGGEAGDETQPSRALEEDVQLEDPVGQVHLGLAGAGEIIVTFVTKEPEASNLVYYREIGTEQELAVGGLTHTYSLLTCISDAVMSPQLGPPKVSVTWEDLVPLFDSSADVPKESTAYLHVEDVESVPGLLKTYEGCMPYNGPHAYTVSPFIHSAVLGNLKPGAVYEYQPHDSRQTFRFKGPRAPGDWLESSPFTLGVWADVGVTNVSLAVQNYLASADPDLILLAGDISYADGWGEIWDTFGEMTQPLLSKVPMLTVPGNHEIDAGREQKKPWLHRYPGPYQAGYSESASFYSYETGPLHIVGLSAPYAPSEYGSAQWQFLEDDLTRVDRMKTPWIIVFFHVPWYNSNLGKYLEGETARIDLEPLLLRYGVDMVFNGHVHSYERSFPVVNGSVDACGITHIVVGDGGNIEGPAVSHGWMDPQPDWSAFREASFGAGNLTVLNATHAVWEWRRVACVHTDGKPAEHSANGKPYYSWDGTSGPPGGPPCATTGDTSEQRFDTSDSVSIVRTMQCRTRYLDVKAEIPHGRTMPEPQIARLMPARLPTEPPPPPTTTQIPAIDALNCSDFVVYPGYFGDLRVSGTIMIEGNENNYTQGLYWKLSGVDDNCLISNVQKKQCAISMQTGTSCHSNAAVGDAYYNSMILGPEDPWSGSRYNTTDLGAIEAGGISLLTGYALEDLVGHAMVVYDSVFPGQRIACCVTTPASKDALAAFQTSLNETLTAALPSEPTEIIPQSPARRPWWVIFVWCVGMLVACALLMWALGCSGTEARDEDEEDELEQARGIQMAERAKAKVREKMAALSGHSELDPEQQPLTKESAAEEEAANDSASRMSSAMPSPKDRAASSGAKTSCFARVCAA